MLINNLKQHKQKYSNSASSSRRQQQAIKSFSSQKIIQTVPSSQSKIQKPSYSQKNFWVAGRHPVAKQSHYKFSSEYENVYENSEKGQKLNQSRSALKNTDKKCYKTQTSIAQNRYQSVQFFQDERQLDQKKSNYKIIRDLNGKIQDLNYNQHQDSFKPNMKIEKILNSMIHQKLSTNTKETKNLSHEAQFLMSQPCERRQFYTINSNMNSERKSRNNQIFKNIKMDSNGDKANKNLIKISSAQLTGKFEKFNPTILNENEITPKKKVGKQLQSRNQDKMGPPQYSIEYGESFVPAQFPFQSVGPFEQNIFIISPNCQPSKQTVQAEQSFLRLLKFNQIFFCVHCFRYVFAIQKNYHHPKCQNLLKFWSMPAKARYDQGEQKLKLLLELDAYIRQGRPKIKESQKISQIYDTAINKKIMPTYQGIETVGGEPGKLCSLQNRTIYSIEEIQRVAWIIVFNLIAPYLKQRSRSFLRGNFINQILCGQSQSEQKSIKNKLQI